MAAPNTERSNDAWITDIAAQDPEALEALRAYLCNRLEGALAGKAGQSDVEDFVHDALPRIAESLPNFRGDSRFTTWAAAIAIRVAYSELRRKRWGSASLESVVDQGVQWEQPNVNAETEAAHTELLNALRDAIDESLTERQRAVVLAELRQMPLAELSDELGMSRGALYKMHHDARKKLRRCLEDKGFTAHDCRAALEGVESK